MSIKFTIFGLGYVGLSLATLISKKHSVTAVDLLTEKVDCVNNRKSPIVDKGIQDYFDKECLELHATADVNVCRDADFVIIATPTNYDVSTNTFDTSSVMSVINKVNEVSKNCTIVIKSTIPIGFTEKLYKSGVKNVLFSPEFLREGKALYDNLHPSRIIVGVPFNDVNLKVKAKNFASVLRECSEEEHTEMLVIGSTEAESIKLFSNTYLAMRVAFFNELDSFAESYGLNAKNIIAGVSLDPRIGDHYNNPSFGYGGYCLPKDTKQLASSFGGVPSELVQSISKSNDLRKKFIADSISDTVKSNGTIGAYKIAMKMGSDNYRESSIIDILNILNERGFRTIIYDPLIADEFLGNHIVVSDIKQFKEDSEIILTNRMDEILNDVIDKVYTRDVFNRD